MRTTILFITTFIICSLNSNAQNLSFAYGKPIVSPINYGFSYFIGEKNNETYLLKVDKSKKNRVVEIYDSKYNLNRKFSVTLNPGQIFDTLVMRNNYPTLLYHVDSKKEKKRTFYLALLDDEANQKNNTILLEAELYKSKKQKSYHINFSKDRATIIIANRPKISKSENEQFEFNTFSKENKLLSKTKVKFNGPTNNFIYHQLLVTSSGYSYLFVEKRTGNKKSPIIQYALLSINGNEGTFQQEGIDARNTYFQRGKFIELENRVGYIGYYVDRSKQKITGMYYISKNTTEKHRKIFYNFADYTPTISRTALANQQSGNLFYHGQIVRYITTDGKNVTVSSESIGQEKVQTVDYFGSYNYGGYGGYGGGYYGGYNGGYYGWGGMYNYGGYGGYGGVSVSTSSYDILGNIHIVTFGKEGDVLQNEIIEKKQYLSSPLSGFMIYTDGSSQLIGFQNDEKPTTWVKTLDDDYFKEVNNIIINKPTYETEERFTLKFKPRTSYYINNNKSLFYYQGKKVHAVGELKIN